MNSILSVWPEVNNLCIPILLQNTKPWTTKEKENNKKENQANKKRNDEEEQTFPYKICRFT